MTREREDLKGVFHIANTTLMEELESNLKMYLDWGFLRIGAWLDVTSPSTPGGYGGNFSQLRLVNDPNYTSGQVWESARKDWVWETGVDYVDLDGDTVNPKVVPATVKVNNVNTNYSWINYPLGRVYFTNPISTTATVLADYSYRWVQVYRASSDDWWKELQYRSFRVDDSYFTQTQDGSWSVGGQHRIQMPTIVIEAMPKAISRPYQLGDGSYWVEQDVICHVLAESGRDRNKLVDILRGQYDSTIWLFNSNSISSAEDWPLDSRGMLVDGTKTYPSLVDSVTGYPWVRCRFSRTEVMNIQAFNSRLYEARVKLTCEVVLPD
jgi:hypothetical protein